MMNINKSKSSQNTVAYMIFQSLFVGNKKAHTAQNLITHSNKVVQ